MQKYRVLHTEWSEGWGGQEIRTISEMEGLAKEGVKCYLACRNNSKIKVEALSRGFKVFVLPFRGSVDIFTMFKLISIIKNHDITIVNTHSGKDTWVGGFAAKMAGIKFIRTRHLANPIRKSKLNFINAMADFVITTGEKVRENMIKNNGIEAHKIQSIPTGVDEELFNPYNFMRSTSRAHLKLAHNEIAIGALGVLRGVKRHIDFVHSAVILNKKYDNLHFFIAGHGPMKEELQKHIASHNLTNFTLLGHTDNPALFLSGLDISVNSSRSEGVPQAVIQALMMNKPMVATDVGSTRDLYHEGNIVFAQPINPEDLAKSIEKVLKSDKMMYNSARDYAVENFSKRAMITNILKVYEKIV